MAAAFRMFFLFPPFYLLFCYLLLYLLQKKKSTANMMKNYGILTFLDLLQAWYKKRKGFITFALLTAQYAGRSRQKWSWKNQQIRYRAGRKTAFYMKKKKNFCRPAGKKNCRHFRWCNRRFSYYQADWKIWSRCTGVCCGICKIDEGCHKIII